jgi:hypothetical protein
VSQHFLFTLSSVPDALPHTTEDQLGTEQFTSFVFVTPRIRIPILAYYAVNLAYKITHISTICVSMNQAIGILREEYGWEATEAIACKQAKRLEKGRRA